MVVRDLPAVGILLPHVREESLDSSVLDSGAQSKGVQVRVQVGVVVVIGLDRVRRSVMVTKGFFFTKDLR